MCFSLKCYYKDVGKSPIENIENCLSYAACRFQITCFEKNAFKVLRYVAEQPSTLAKRARNFNEIDFEYV